MSDGPKVSRRLVLRGIGGTVLALPILESLAGSGAEASDDVEPYAIFFRQANGAQSEVPSGAIGAEPERFFPRTLGPLDAANIEGRAVGELAGFEDRLLVLRNVDMQGFDYGDGHARGALQCLTAQGPTVAGQGGNSEAAGESIDNLIGRELNPGGRDSLFLYAGRNSGWLGGACISYRGPATRRNPHTNPWNAYQLVVGGAGGMSEEAQRQIVERRRSVNDLVRGQMSRLLGHPRLSDADRRRLELHRAAIRDLELGLVCRLDEAREREIEGNAGYDQTNGDEVLGTARLHMDVAALAVACGITRAVAIQVGNGNDGTTRYRNPATGALMENYHYVSHRRLSHGSDGAVIPDSDLLHHEIDRQFAQTFRHLLARLESYPTASGATLLECGVSAWLNDLSRGPGHGRNDVPWVLAGSAGGFLRTGQFIDVDTGAVNHPRLLATIASAAGVRKPDGSLFDEFGDPSLPRGILDSIVA